MSFRVTSWIILFLVFHQYCFSQPTTPSSEQQLANLRNVIPPSPNASSLGKYGDWPVSLYTGVPNISIPIYELKGRSLNIPVSISYHAAGNKVGEIASWVGLGWNLNAGGMISRSIRGLPDESGYFNYTSEYSSPDDFSSTVSTADRETRKVATANNTQDSEQDIYSLSALGKSYKFMLKADGTVLTIPFSKVRVDKNPIVGTTNKSTDDSWVITFEDGSKMIFGSTGFVETTSNNSIGIAYTSSWLLKTVISSTGESVSFTYSYTSADQDSYFSQSDWIQYLTGTNQASYCSLLNQSPSIVSIVSKQTILTASLSSIESDLGRIDFLTASGARQDLKGGKVLSEIKVFSKLAGTYIDDYLFNTSYSQAVSSLELSDDVLPGDGGYYEQRLRLDNIQKKSISNPSLPNQVWQFDYNPQHLPSRRSFAQDHWGFFNGAVQNSSLLPTIYISIPLYMSGLANVGFSGNSSREGNESYMQAEILTAIHYPTGGKSQFIFEGNKKTVTEEQFQDAGIDLTLNLAPGQPTFSTETFTITKPEIINLNNTVIITGNVLNDQQSANGIAQILNSNGDPLITITGTGSSVLNLPNAGTYTLKISSVNADPSNFSGSDHLNIECTVGYQQSIGVQTVDKLLGGLRVSSIASYDGISPTAINVRAFTYGDPFVINPIDPATDYLTEQAVHTSTDLTLGVECYYNKEIRNSSTKFAAGSIQGGTVGYGKVTTKNGLNAENGKTESYFSNEEDGFAYESKIFPYSMPDSRDNRRGLLLKQIEFNAQGTMLKIDSNSYDFSFVYSIIGFKAGYAEVVPTTWCLDQYRDCGIGMSYSYTSTEQVKHLSTTQTSYDQYGLNPLTSVTNYFYDNPNNLQATRTEFTDSKNNVMKEISRTALEKSDINNLATLSADASIAIDTMLARNMISAAIQHDHFSNNVLLNRSLTNYKVWNANSVTPQNVQLQKTTNPLETRLQFYNYDEYGNMLEQSKADDLHEIYLWGYKSNLPVAKITNSTYAAASALISQSVLDNPTDDVSFRSYLNILRSLSGAMVTTYTYAPLIGITSETDPAGKTTYYEYDGFNRLKNIKDYQGNIVKNFQYNYAGSCGDHCVVLPMQTFTSYNTPGYPVGVFNINKNFIDTARTPAEYVAKWNSNAGNQAIGLLSANADSLHFNLTLATGAAAPPALYGLRYYQWAGFTQSSLNIGTDTLSYVDWGDGNNQLVTAPRTGYYDSIPYSYVDAYLHFDQICHWIRLAHTYTGSSPRTLTVFHNETTEIVATSCGPDDLVNNSDFKGNYPEKVKSITYNNMSNASDLGIANFSHLTDVLEMHYQFSNSGTLRDHQWQSINNFHNLKWLKIDFKNGLEIAGNIGVNFPLLKYLETQGYKPDIKETWSGAGFSNLYILAMGMPSPGLTTTEADLILNKQAAANTISHGFMGSGPTPVRTHSSDTAYNALIGRNWTILFTNPQ